MDRLKKWITKDATRGLKATFTYLTWVRKNTDMRSDFSGAWRMANRVEEYVKDYRKVIRRGYTIDDSKRRFLRNAIKACLNNMEAIQEGLDEYAAPDRVYDLQVLALDFLNEGFEAASEPLRYASLRSRVINAAWDNLEIRPQLLGILEE